MKIAVSVQEIQSLEDNDLRVGVLVVSKVDPCARGLIVEFVADDVVSVLWSSPPRETSKADNRGIW